MVPTCVGCPLDGRGVGQDAERRPDGGTIDLEIMVRARQSAGEQPADELRTRNAVLLSKLLEMLITAI